MTSRPPSRSTVCGYAPRLFVYAAATIAAAVPALGGAIAAVVLSPPTAATAVGVAVFFALVLLAELRPVPLDVEESRLVSLAFVFIVAANIVFGWQYGVLIAAGALLVAQAIAQTPVIRNLFNASAYALSAAVAALPGGVMAHDVAAQHYGQLTALTFVEGAIFVFFNVLLVCAAISLHERLGLRGVIVDHLRHSGPAFAIMAFIAALAVALWAAAPALLILLAGPVFAVALLQRYALRTRVALQAASTDSLTMLPNHRQYENDIAAQLRGCGDHLSLCLLDIDNFKRLNDRFGHPVGDRFLRRFGELLASMTEPSTAYRLGGDEFAVLIPDGAHRAVAALEPVREALAREELPDGTAFTFSAGIACHPMHGLAREELVHAADEALYRAKRHGKDRICIFDPTVVELAPSYADEHDVVAAPEPLSAARA